MFCNKCGNSLSDGASFCSKCGNPVASAAKSTGSSSVSGTASGSQPPLTSRQTDPGNQSNNGSQNQKIPWKPISVIGGIVLCVIALIVLIVILINDYKDGDSGRKSKDKDAVSANEEMLLGKWTSRRDSAFGSDFTRLLMDAMIETYRENEPDTAEALEWLFGSYSANELLEFFELDELTEIVLDFEKNGNLRVKMYDEWTDADILAFSYKVAGEETISLSCRMQDDEEGLNFIFSYEGEYKVDKNSLILDFFGNKVKFDRK